MLIDYLSRICKFSQQELDFIQSKIQQKQISNGSTIVESGRVCNKICFINQGLFKSIVENKNSSQIVGFFEEGEFVTDYISYLTTKRSDMRIIAIEDAIIEVLDRQSVESIYINCPTFQQFGRLMAEKYFIHLAKRVKNSTLPAKEKYDLFMAERPNLLQRVPQYMIASYLAISPEWLSKLRAKKGS